MRSHFAFAWGTLHQAYLECLCRHMFVIRMQGTAAAVNTSRHLHIIMLLREVLLYLFLALVRNVCRLL